MNEGKGTPLEIKVRPESPTAVIFKSALAKARERSDEQINLSRSPRPASVVSKDFKSLQSTFENLVTRTLSPLREQPKSPLTDRSDLDDGISLSKSPSTVGAMLSKSPNATSSNAVWQTKNTLSSSIESKLSSNRNCRYSRRGSVEGRSSRAPRARQGSAERSSRARRGSAEGRTVRSLRAMSSSLQSSTPLVPRCNSHKTAYSFDSEGPVATPTDSRRMAGRMNPIRMGHERSNGSPRSFRGSGQNGSLLSIPTAGFDSDSQGSSIMSSPMDSPKEKIKSNVSDESSERFARATILDLTPRDRLDQNLEYSYEDLNMSRYDKSKKIAHRKDKSIVFSSTKLSDTYIDFLAVHSKESSNLPKGENSYMPKSGQIFTSKSTDDMSDCINRVACLRTIRDFNKETKGSISKLAKMLERENNVLERLVEILRSDDYNEDVFLAKTLTELRISRKRTDTPERVPKERTGPVPRKGSQPPITLERVLSPFLKGERERGERAPSPPSVVRNVTRRTRVRRGRNKEHRSISSLPMLSQLCEINDELRWRDVNFAVATALKAQKVARKTQSKKIHQKVIKVAEGDSMKCIIFRVHKINRWHSDSPREIEFYTEQNKIVVVKTSTRRRSKSAAGRTPSPRAQSDVRVITNSDYRGLVLKEKKVIKFYFKRQGGTEKGWKFRFSSEEKLQQFVGLCKRHLGEGVSAVHGSESFSSKTRRELSTTTSISISRNSSSASRNTNSESRVRSSFSRLVVGKNK